MEGKAVIMCFLSVFIYKCHNNALNKIQMLYMLKLNNATLISAISFCGILFN